MITLPLLSIREIPGVPKFATGGKNFNKSCCWKSYGKITCFASLNKTVVLLFHLWNRRGTGYLGTPPDSLFQKKIQKLCIFVLSFQLSKTLAELHSLLSIKISLIVQISLFGKFVLYMYIIRYA